MATSKVVFELQDDSIGGLAGDLDPGLTGWLAGIVDYIIGGSVQFFPDRTATVPSPIYSWVTQPSGYVNVNTDEGTKEVVKERVMTGVAYVSTSVLFPADGIVEVRYFEAEGANVADYSETMEKSYEIVTGGQAVMAVPGSVHLKIGTTDVFDRSGILYKDNDPDTNEATPIGTFDYVKSLAKIDNDFSHDSMNLPATVISCVGTTNLEMVTTLFFRTPGAPLRSGSLSISATAGNGDLLTATSDFDGIISGDDIFGEVNFLTGICTVFFGSYVDDDATAQGSDWYDVETKDADTGKVLRPTYVIPSTVMLNCVVTSYLPLDEELLGLNPIRLPLDGKVPIFRDGQVIVVHNTLSEQMPDALTSSQVFTINRNPVSLIELYDADGLFVPDTHYTTDKDLGQVTMSSSLDLTGYVEPLVVMHRIEDMKLVSDVQITGHMAITAPLEFSYPADTTLVSSVLPSGDLQSRAYNEFTQESWTGVWSDTCIGDSTMSNYDLVNYPITVVNANAVQERFCILFTSSTTFQVSGEHLGIIATGSTSGVCAPINPATGFPYFTIQAAGWGSGWSSGDCFRFNSDAANFPFWIARTTLQGPETENADDYTMQLRGDSS